MTIATSAFDEKSLTVGEQVLQRSVLEKIEVALARTEAELTASFSILYDAYYQAGLVEANTLGVRLTPFHLLPTTEVFVAKVERHVNSTLTMVGDGAMGLPMDSIYSEETTWLRSKGFRLAEIGSLADRRNSTVKFVRVFKELAKLVVQVAEQRGINGLVIATHPRHAGFYIRSFGFQQIGGLTDCPYARGNPAVALLLDFYKIRGSQFEERLFFPRFQMQELSLTQWCDETMDLLSGYVKLLYDN